MDINERLKNDHASSPRGAQMGRLTWAANRTEECQFYLQKVKFEDDCYDLGGAYWGMPENLWCAWEKDERVRTFLRAKDYESARAQVLDCYPDAIFMEK